MPTHPSIRKFAVLKSSLILGGRISAPYKYAVDPLGLYEVANIDMMK
jgi:hypothetical protein